MGSVAGSFPEKYAGICWTDVLEVLHIDEEGGAGECDLLIWRQQKRLPSELSNSFTFAQVQRSTSASCGE